MRSLGGYRGKGGWIAPCALLLEGQHCTRLSNGSIEAIQDEEIGREGAFAMLAERTQSDRGGRDSNQIEERQARSVLSPQYSSLGGIPISLTEGG
jgi:hypothetical protein